MMSGLEEFGLKVSKDWKGLNKKAIILEIRRSFAITKKLIYSDFDIPNQFGIYAFFIKPNENYSDIESLEVAWNIKSFRKFPNVVKKRFSISESKDGWFPFYIGKSEKLGSRINEHLKHHSQHSTYGLKLKYRASFLKNNQIEVGYWCLPEMSDVSNEIKQFIITNLESQLREEMKPWIGKQ